MSNSISDRQPCCAGVNINCYTIDPTKLPPNSPFFNVPPICTVDKGNGPVVQSATYPGTYYNTYNNGNAPATQCPTYPGAYYMNNYNTNSVNTRKKRIQVLTDDYIKNLELYLNSPSEEMRKHAAQEVIKRFDEDKTRYDDAALNALINKMLKDPCHKIKNTALLALETQLAQGNQNTVKILENMAQNDKSRGGADALTASNILLKMSSGTKLIDVPIQQNDSISKGLLD